MSLSVNTRNLGLGQICHFTHGDSLGFETSLVPDKQRYA